MVLPPPAVAILLVDDDATLATLTAHLLRGRGYAVTLAATAAAARDLLGRDDATVTVLVTDLALADGSGIALARQARALDPTLAIVLITGHDLADLRAQLPAGPGVALLQKPFTLAQLVACVRSVAAARPVRPA